MYEHFYKFSGSPFRLTPDHRFFYGSKGHQRALAYLRYGIQQREGFIVVTGEIGSGKTTLIKQLFSELDPRRTLAAQIVTTSVHGDDLLALLADAFGIITHEPTKSRLLISMEKLFQAQYELGRRILVVVDEAHNLREDTIEELRMLSNFQRDEEAMIQVFLLGQPQFNDTLAQPGMEQVRQRIIASCFLAAMSSDETRQYIEHRLGLADWVGDPLITDEAFLAIYKFTRGVPRRINAICNRLLLYGALEELHVLDEFAVKAVVEDIKKEVSGDEADETSAGVINGSQKVAVAADVNARFARTEQTLIKHDKALHCLIDATDELLLFFIGREQN